MAPVLFTNYLEQVLTIMEKEKRLVALAGDFNYNMVKESIDSHVSSFCNLLASYGYISLISRPTRVVKNHSSLLDNIFVNNHNLVKSSGVLITDLSDHFTIYGLLSLLQKRESQPVKFQKEIFNMQKIPELNEYLEDQLASFQTITDPNLACDLLVKSYTEGILKYTKTVKPSRRRVPLKPWISPGILCSINRKNKLYKKYLQTNSDKHEKAYQKYRNFLTNVLREAKRLYFQNYFKACKGSSKETWKLLREATNSKKDPVQLPPFLLMVATQLIVVSMWQKASMTSLHL